MVNVNVRVSTRPNEYKLPLIIQFLSIDYDDKVLKKKIGADINFNSFFIFNF